ncbi:MAG: glycosyltransferase [Lachnospiraceae bacterium]|nr:glycosyltransferase [Lachnospiraceae bacterium]
MRSINDYKAVDPDDLIKPDGRLEVLVACVRENPIMLAEHMNLSTAAVICNQCQEISFEEFMRKGRRIRAYSFAERGVGLNRNNALMRAASEFALFSDDDIIYDDDYEDKVLREFDRNPKADILMFNVSAVESRRTYENVRHKKVRWYNYGRYPTYSMCVRTESIRKANVYFSLLFGGGAKYSNGEDTLFIHDCLKKGLKIYGVPVNIGHEDRREGDGPDSTWFTGYNEKFFYDRGVLYKYLYGVMKKPFAALFLLRHGKKMCTSIKPLEAYRLMKKGMSEG